MSPQDRRRERRARHRAGEVVPDEVRLLCEVIVEAWTSEAPPGFIEPHCARDECVRIAAYFSSRSWTGVRFDDVRKACQGAFNNPLPMLPPTPTGITSRRFS